MLQIISANGDIVLGNVMEADTFWQRFRGLMLNKNLSPQDALLLYPCKSVHCCFMRLPIDILFLSKERRIVYMIERMKPWSFSPYIREACAVLECYPGTIAKHHLQVGECIIIH